MNVSHNGSSLKEIIQKLIGTEKNNNKCSSIVKTALKQQQQKDWVFKKNLPFFKSSMM